MAELEPALAALQMAIQTEIDGRNFYSQFARQTQDDEARAMFERLAQDEVKHLEILQAAKETLETKGTWTEYAGMEPAAAPGAPIFSRERVEQNIMEYASDLSAVRMAYLIERDAVDFYQRALGQTEDPRGKQMFQDLMRMEQGHLDLLQGEYEFLRGQFQLSMGFSPF